MQTIRFFVNGMECAVDASHAGQTLLAYLREALRLTGTKNGCGTGHCGACTVLLDGKPRRACATRLKSLDGVRVLTIEGLAQNGTLHPVQRAFLDAGAIQCGFCTPGMILTAVALLDEHPRPTRAQIERALEANICRCTGYVKILQAVELASMYLLGQGPRPGQTLDAYLHALPETGSLERTFVTTEDCPSVERPQGPDIGSSPWDADGVQKADGTLRYADDLDVPGMLYGAFRYAGIPHGRITGVDPSRAASMPGVVRVLTASDVPGQNGYGILQQDQPVFCDGEVRFAFDAVALAVAQTIGEARLAAAAIEVAIEPLPPVLDMEDALAQGLIHKELGTDIGDADAAMRAPDTITVRGRFSTTYQEHAYLEPECALAEWDDATGLTLTATTQSVFELRRVLMQVLGEPEERIRVCARTLGGGFGSKADFTIEPAAAVAACVLQRPVKITLTRAESLGVSTKRHPYRMDYALTVDRDGTLRAFSADLLSDGGPYLNLSPRVIDQACLFSVGPYRMQNGRVFGRALRTNNVPCGAFRGFGINQSNFAMESLLDEAAEALGMDPFALRIQNAFVPGDATVSGEILRNSVGILPALRLCQSETQKAVAALKDAYPKGSLRLGVGVAAGFKNVGAGKGKVDDAGAIYTVLPDGRVELRVSGIDMGQGFRTAMRQLAAETLGIAPSEIEAFNGDTARTYHHANAVGERQTLINGSAVVEAGKRLNARMAAALGVTAAKPLAGVPCAARTALAGMTLGYHYASPKTFPLDNVAGKRAVPPEEYRNYPGYAYVAQSAIVEVDTSTGAVRVLRVIAAHDLGRVLNRHVVEGQLEGSCAMGIGYALSEHFDVENGLPTTKNMGQLGLLKPADTPDYTLLLIENPNPDGPFGAKGVSEVATVPMAAAVINAVYNACGVRIRNLPATPETILSALDKRQ